MRCSSREAAPPRCRFRRVPGAKFQSSGAEPAATLPDLVPRTEYLEPQNEELRGTVSRRKYRLAGEEVVLPRLLPDLFGGRHSEPGVLAPSAAERGLQGRNADHRALRLAAE